LCTAGITRLTESSARVVVLWCHENDKELSEAIFKEKEGRREIEKNKYLQKIINLCHGLLFDVILAFDVEGKKKNMIFIYHHEATVLETRLHRRCFEFE